MLTCNKYKKQYTGKTTDNFHGKWYKTKGSKRGEKCMQEHLYRFFESEGHTEFLDDVLITLIDKTDGSNPTKRAKYKIQIFKTFALYSPNVVDSI